MTANSLSLGRTVRRRCAAIVLSGAVSSILPTAPAIAQEAISESDIVAFIAEMEYHTNRGDVETLVGYIDPEASFAIASDIGAEPALVRIDNLETFFANGFEGLDNYEIDLDIDNISIEDSVATVTGSTVDRSVRGGLSTVSTLDWTGIIERQEDELKVIQWRSRMTGYAIREVAQ